MGVERKVLKKGNGTDKPKKGDEVTIEYTGNLYDESKADNDYRGKQFDTSIDRGDFKTKIGVGKVIRGMVLSGLHQAMSSLMIVN
ncbi:MAG: hypothetical protein Q9188_002729 [Gyalolechia gomerana]|nr:MAG: hypothetical protein LQ343_005418 [Gyalolechia ehrenbergii]